MEKFERKYALIELWSNFIDILAFELGKLCPGVGILFRFFRLGGRSFALKSWAGILTEKNSGPAVSPGEMVTSQIDTCITLQPTSQMQISLHICSSDKQSFISQILKVVGPLAEKFKFSFPWGFKLKCILITQTRESSPLFQSFKTIPERRKLTDDKKTTTLIVLIVNFS